MAYLTCAFTRVRFCKGYQPSQPECASTENGGKFVWPWRPRNETF